MNRTEAPAVSPEVSDRVRSGLKVLWDSRVTPEPLWGDGLTVLDPQTAELPLVIRKGLATKKVLTEMPIKIGQHELIVGHPLPGNIETLGEGFPPFPDYATDDELDAAAELFTGPRSVFGHFCPDYAYALNKGFSGLRQMAAAKLAELREGTVEPAEPTSAAWYESVIISLDALVAFIHRYRDLALQMADGYGTPDPARQAELRGIAEVCERIADNPPQTFREALQAVWFAHAAFSSTLNIIPIGRFDQFLYSYLEHDINTGNITLTEAQELVDLFFLKCCEREKTWELVCTPNRGNAGPVSKRARAQGIGLWSAFQGGKCTQDRFAADGAAYLNLMTSIVLSGSDSEGQDQTNPLSYLCLDALRRLKLPVPYVYVRVHENTPAELIERSADCIRAGCAAPSVMWDEPIAKAFQEFGLPMDDALDYAPSGCFEIYPAAGKTYFKLGWISVAESLSRVISPAYWENFRASDLYLERYDPFFGTDSPDPRSFGSFEDLMSLVKVRLDQNVRKFIETASEMRDGRLYSIAPETLLSAFVEGPLETGKDLTLNSMKYQTHSVLLVGLSVAADSLAAIKKLCFDERVVSLEEMLDAIDANWEGHESLRQMAMAKVPAFGNDDDYVDDIARGLVDHFVESVKEHGSKANSSVFFLPGIATFEHWQSLGKDIPATPDGRLLGEALGPNASPTNGRAYSGRTAAVNSYLKLPLDRLPGAAALDICIDGGTNEVSHIESFIAPETRGNVLTITAENYETMKDAREHPERHRDLIVRLAGTQVFFVDLPLPQQDSLLARCAQYATSRG